MGEHLSHLWAVLGLVPCTSKININKWTGLKDSSECFRVKRSKLGSMGVILLHCVQCTPPSHTLLPVLRGMCPYLVTRGTDCYWSDPPCGTQGSTPLKHPSQHSREQSLPGRPAASEAFMRIHLRSCIQRNRFSPPGPKASLLTEEKVAFEIYFFIFKEARSKNMDLFTNVCVIFSVSFQV